MDTKLSEYCVFIRGFVEDALETLDKEGVYESEWNGKVYRSKTEYLDDVVRQLCQESEAMVNDVNLVEAFRLSGVVDGYLKSTDIAARVIKDRNPLGFLKRNK
jgi:hypothetical protein